MCQAGSNNSVCRTHIQFDRLISTLSDSYLLCQTHIQFEWYISTLSASYLVRQTHILFVRIISSLPAACPVCQTHVQFVRLISTLSNSYSVCQTYIPDCQTCVQFVRLMSSLSESCPGCQTYIQFVRLISSEHDDMSLVVTCDVWKECHKSLSTSITCDTRYTTAWWKCNTWRHALHVHRSYHWILNVRIQSMKVAYFGCKTEIIGGNTKQNEIRNKGLSRYVTCYDTHSSI